MQQLGVDIEATSGALTSAQQRSSKLEVHCAVPAHTVHSSYVDAQVTIQELSPAVAEYHE